MSFREQDGWARRCLVGTSVSGRSGTRTPGGSSARSSTPASALVEARKGKRLGTLFPVVGGDGWLCVGPDGHYRGSEGIEKHIVYVALLDDGSQKTCAPQAFADAFGWKNDPSKARLMKLDP